MSWEPGGRRDGLTSEHPRAEWFVVVFSDPQRVRRERSGKWTDMGVSSKSWAREHTVRLNIGGGSRGPWKVTAGGNETRCLSHKTGRMTNFTLSVWIG